jgi:hypothetical protein
MVLLARKLMVVDAPSGIQFVGGKAAGKNGATSGNTTLSLTSDLTGGIASSVSNNDLVVAAFATGSNADRTLSITDGANPYTLIGTELYANDNGDTNLRVAYKFVSGDTATTFGPTGATADDGTTAVYVFRGVNMTTPLDVAAVTATGINASNANPPSITPTTPGAFILCIGAACPDAGATSFSSSDLVLFRSVNNMNGSFFSLMGLGIKDDWVSGAFDAAAFTPSNTTTADSWAAMSIALRPA